MEVYVNGYITYDCDGDDEFHIEDVTFKPKYAVYKTFYGNYVDRNTSISVIQYVK